VKRLSQRATGLLVVIAFVALALVVFNKERVGGTLGGLLAPANSINAEFERGHKLL
jgi:hypothetical protein